MPSSLITEFMPNVTQIPGLPVPSYPCTFALCCPNAVMIFVAVLDTIFLSFSTSETSKTANMTQNHSFKSGYHNVVCLVRESMDSFSGQWMALLAFCQAYTSAWHLNNSIKAEDIKLQFQATLMLIDITASGACHFYPCIQGLLIWLCNRIVHIMHRLSIYVILHDLQRLCRRRLQDEWLVTVSF